jgi:hypothetical protein
LGQDDTELQKVAELNRHVMVYTRGVGLDKTAGYFWMQKVRWKNTPGRTRRQPARYPKGVAVAQVDFAIHWLFSWISLLAGLLLLLVQFWKIPAAVRTWLR